ncbi:MAG TPA: TSUP family transporter [Beijerinckiaceae bacterium]
MSGLEPEIVAALFAVAVVAGCFDAIAGGGGLLTVPALLMAGFDPVAAIATNKVQGSVGALSATAAFARKGLIDWRSAAPLALIAAAGSLAGALSVKLMSRPLLEAAIPVLLVGIALFFAFSRRLSDADARARLSVGAFACTVPPLVGFYDGVFGPGAGSFYMVGFVTLLGYGAVRATAHTKLANAASNLGSLGLFAASGLVAWPVGLVMAGGAFLGAQLGSHLAIRLGARLIRPLLVTISCAMALRLLADPANPWRQALSAALRAS